MIIKFNDFLNENKLDDILDKISAIGMKSLTDKEMKYLNNASQGNYEDEKEEEYTPGFSSSEPVIITCTNKNIPQLKYSHHGSAEIEGELVYDGSIIFGNEYYWGYIYCDYDGNFDRAEFHTEKGVDLYDAGERNIVEINNFFDKEVCEQLKMTN